MPDDRRAGALVRRATDSLSGVATARLDARTLFLAATGWTAADLIAREHDLVPEEYISRFQAMLDRRRLGEPVDRILGIREFWSLPFTVTPDVLSPRPDSETLIEVCLARSATPPRRIADIGTGTGCLLAALLSEFPHAEGVAVDNSDGALAVARQNFTRLGLDRRVELICAGMESVRFLPADLIISNPPYIAEGDKSSLPVEVRDHDPAGALFGGEDGLDCFRVIASRLHQWGRAGALVVLEVGHDQAEQVSDLLRQAGGVAEIQTMQDLAGQNRCVSAKLTG